jgi:hypothetical protein
LFASQSFWPQWDEFVWSAENEAKPYQIPRLQRRSQPIDPIGKSQNIEKIGLTTNFFSSLLKACSQKEGGTRPMFPAMDRHFSDARF